MKDRSKFQISERHILALNLLCYLPILLETRLTAGIVGYMSRAYSPSLPFFFGIWATFSVFYLLLRPAKPVMYVICGFPIIAHWVMGLWWWLSDLSTVPVGACFLPLAIVIDITWLLYSRLRPVKGAHEDDTILPGPDTDW